MDEQNKLIQVGVALSQQETEWLRHKTGVDALATAIRALIRVTMNRECRELADAQDASQAEAER